MIKFSAKLKTIILLAFVVFNSGLFAQTTISSLVGSSNYTSSNSLASNSGITFVIENTSGDVINLSQVSTFLVVANTGMIPGLWYSSTSLSGATPVVASPNWTLITTGTPVTVNTDGVYNLFTGLSFLIPNNTQYRFAIQSSNGIRYSGTNNVNDPIPTPSSFSSLGVTLKAGDAQIAGLNVGYNVLFPAGTMPNTPRFFSGSITFEPAPACVAPPIGSTTVSNVSIACQGTNFNLDLSGQSTGSSLTYQWQSSIDNITYTDILGATNQSLITSQNQTLYYRNRITCSAQSAFSTPVLVGNLPTIGSGIYTINKSQPTSGTNFNSFTDALASFVCGISGPVTFNVDSASGPYIGQVNFGAIPGADATNTVTFNGNGALLIYSSSLASSRHVVQLNGTDYLTFSDFNIQVPDTSAFGWGIHVTNNANFNRIKNNNLKINLTQTTTNFAGIVLSGSTTSATIATVANSNIIENNVISGGYYGITIVGATGLVGIGQNSIRNNIIKDFYFYGVYLSNNDSTTVSGNDISRKLRNNGGTFYGIFLTSANSNSLLEKNIIHDTHTAIGASTSVVAGIYLTASDAIIGEPNIISNNIIHTLNTNGISYGLYNASSDNVLYYYNTISVNSPGSTAGDSRGFYQTTLATGIEVKNNIFNVQKEGSGVEHALYFNTLISTIASDNNALFVDTLGTGLAFIGNLGGTTNNFKTIELWRASGAGVFDSASVSADPQFNSPFLNNFIPTSPAINNIGTPIFNVVDDIANVLRDVNSPDPGAYEFSPGTLDAGLDSFVQPQFPCPGLNSVSVRLTNFGLSPITSATINWTLNNVAQTPFNYIGNLSSSFSDTVLLGSFNIVGNNSYDLKAFTSSPNGTTDANATNDTILVSTTGALPIVNLGSNGNFCAGNSVQLGDSLPAGTYLWSTGETSQIIFIDQPGSYFVTVTNAAGCSKSDTAVYGLFLPSDPNFIATKAQSSRVVNFVPSLSGGTHFWDFGDGIGTSKLANPTYNYLVNGNFQVKHTLETTNGCIDSILQIVLITTPVGISEQFISAFSYQIYPNPIQTETRISFELKERATVQVKIYDVLGRIVLQPMNTTQSIGKHEVLVNKDMLQNGSGVYEIQLIVNGQSETLRLVKTE